MSLWGQSFGTTWRKALVSLPRIVPNAALYYTSPEGPHPFVLKLLANEPRTHSIPVYIFLQLPPVPETETPTSSRPSTPRGSKHSPGASKHRASTPQLSTHASKSPARGARPILNLPVIVDFHGGSFILGTPQEQAPFCAHIAREIGACVVISVDYRVGPYAQYPAANEDAEDVIRAVLDEDTPAGRILREDIRQHAWQQGRKEWIDLDTERIAISGFSSGGNLALNMVLSVKDDPTINQDWPAVIPPSYNKDIPVLLFYPSLDARLLPDERPRPEGLDPPSGFFTRLKIESELMPKYLPIEQRHHPRASPGLAPVKDGGLHPRAKTMLVLPELDSLSSQSLEWIRKVQDDGRGDDLVVVPVKGVYHGWTQFPDSFLKTEDEKQKKYEVFTQAQDFVKMVWGKET